MSDEMSAKPVAWMTPGGDVSRSLEWCKERCWPEGEQPTPLYAQSTSVARAMAIAEAARECEETYPEYRGNGVMEHLPCYSTPRECAAAIRALSSPPSVTEEWVAERVITCKGTNIEAGVRATLAALGVEVKS